MLPLIKAEDTHALHIGKLVITNNDVYIMSRYCVYRYRFVESKEVSSMEWTLKSYDLSAINFRIENARLYR